jgi:hypothetical protein
LRIIDLDLYPYKRFIGSGRCAKDLFKKLPEDKIRDFFYQAADWRLKRKWQYFQNRVTDPNLYISTGIAMALGYKNNSEAFGDLFLELQKQPINDELDALAWLMRQGGFFSDYFFKKWGESSFYRQLQNLPLSTDKPTKIVLNQIRPLNHPVRRFAYMAKLHFDPNSKLLMTKLVDLWKSEWKKAFSEKKMKSLVKLMQDLIPNYQDCYWNSHYLFETEEKKETLTLLGEDLKIEIIVNTFLPVLQEALFNDQADEVEWNSFRSLYHSIAASKTGKAKYLTHRFFGDTLKGNVLKSAYVEQGAYQLHYDFCVHFEASCKGCPFVERFNQTFV